MIGRKVCIAGRVFRTPATEGPDLPALLAQRSMYKKLIDYAGGPAGEPLAAKRGRPSPVAVLVVEDEELVRLNATAMLAALGYLVLEACCAPTALEQLRLHPEISVLFTDIDMPGAFDGLALAHKAHLLRPDIYLIMTSGRARPGSAQLCGGDFLPKPYSDQTLVDLICAATGGSPKGG